MAERLLLKYKTPGSILLETTISFAIPLTLIIFSTFDIMGVWNKTYFKIVVKDIHTDNLRVLSVDTKSNKTDAENILALLCSYLTAFYLYFLELISPKHSCGPINRGQSSEMKHDA